MKANVERRQQLERDIRAMLLMMGYFLNVLYAEPYNWGPKRLQRLYDLGLDLMFEESFDEFSQEIITYWMERMGLTVKDYEARKIKSQKEAAESAHT